MIPLNFTAGDFVKLCFDACGEIIIHDIVKILLEEISDNKTQVRRK